VGKILKKKENSLAFPAHDKIYSVVNLFLFSFTNQAPHGLMFWHEIIQD
jgi:hypothetical protein